jgi:hypothetical protein
MKKEKKIKIDKDSIKRTNKAFEKLFKIKINQ